MKAYRLVFLFVLLLIGSAYAESEMRMRGLENRIDRIEKQQGTTPTPTNIDSLTPCAGPRVKDGMDLHLSADFIYWTARLDGLTYAKTGHGNLQNNVNPKKGKVQSVNWSWDPGFKAGLGWIFCHGCWDMNLQYTWFYTNVGATKRSNFLQPSYDILPDAINADDITFTNAHAHYDLHFQVGDLELGRNYYVSRYLKVRPFIGIKGTWQKQDYNTFYDAIPIATLQETFNAMTRFNSSTWGLGMRGGLNTSWQFSKNVGIYGNLALTGIWLHYDLDRKDTFETIEGNPQVPPTKITTYNIQDHLRLIKPVLEFGIGLRLEAYFACNRYHLLLQGGWESQIWINEVLQITKNGHYDRFDLNMHGLTTKLRFDF
jgi:hypothetical protein